MNNIVKNSSTTEIENIIKCISSELKSDLVYIDIVSIEKKTNKPYYIEWYGNDEVFLTKYKNLINNYFNNSNSKSLLFLNTNTHIHSNKIIDNRHVLFEDVSKSSCDCKVNTNFKFKKQFTLTDEKVEIKNEKEHIEKWEKEILSKLCVPSAIFSKIEFKIDKKEYIAAIWIGFNKKIKTEYEKSDKYNLYVENFLLSYSLSTIASELLTESKRNLTKVAIADIINRNYAHHIGSHVSHRATFEKILERLRIDFNNSIDKPTLATIVRLRSILETYKDQRSEFIAGITNYQVYQSFCLYKDVLLPFIENTLLIDNIAANEGIKYFHYDNDKLDINTAKKSQSRLVIRLWIEKKIVGATANCTVTCPEQERLTPVPDKFIEQFACYKVNNNTYTSLCLPYYREINNLHDDFYDDKGFNLAFPDIQVSLPGTLGTHAIYSLLENYIRNTAKHAYDPQEHKDKLVEVILKLSAGEGKNADDYKLTITDNISDNNKAVELQKKINIPLTSREGDKIGGMGIADMKICATLLNGQDLTEEKMKTAICCHEDDKHIAYSLTLLKPREAALIGSTGITESRDEGVFHYENIDGYLKDRERGYRFALVESDVLNKEGFSRHWLPLRMIVFDEGKKNGIEYEFENGYVKTCLATFDGNGSNLLEKCWQTWLKGKLGDDYNNIHLGVYFEQKEGETPTSDWKSKLKTFNNSNFFYDTDNGTETNKASCPEFPSNMTNILFDRHGGLISKANDVNFIENHFYELIDKNNPDFDLLFTANTQKEPFLLPYEMIDAGMLNVLVIDERVAEVVSNNIVNSTHYRKLLLKGFKKCDHDKDNSRCTLFDACWAAHIYVATHIGVTNDQLKYLAKEIVPNCNHYLKITFLKGKDQIKIVSSTNIKESKQNNLNFDCLLIHRTKLDELLKELNINFDEFAQMVSIPKIFVVTGGGSVDFVQEQNKITILPTNILKEFVMGARPAKIYLSQILK